MVKFKFLVIPAVALVASVVAEADQLQSFEDAKERIYPGQSLKSADFTLSDSDYIRLKFDYKVPSLRPLVKVWRTDSGDWLFLDQVYGLNDIVTYLLGVDSAGNITGLEVLTCAEGFCESLYTEQWVGQMSKVRHGRWMPEEVVPIISGATLSTTHVAEGVKKLLAIHARYLPHVGES
ncbi:FMN-binding protein [Haliea sp. E1-2-M8]|uniref:FMN-binding protein n=1 Tax=Haliea sp. E1-2-M8 TaxID=3064706 RepID=UPI0027255EF8|nr:FMN-binding protein [Haliea sp. E1-2-M8]MDO8864187.1 FMN-binding protein [Haliea sp. E1-2-M8]